MNTERTFALSRQSSQENAAGPAENPAHVRVGFDLFDSIPLVTTDPDVYAVAGQNAIAATSAIHREGARGPACRRLLARDIVVSRSQLRFVQGLRNVVLKLVAKGREQPHRLHALERIADNEHRRLLESIDMLARLEGRSPVVNVTAHQAAVVLGGRDEG